MKTIAEILGQNANITISIGIQELRSVFAETIRDERKRIEKETREKCKKNDVGKLLSREEACNILKVGLTTLWQWDKRGYLKAIKAGGRVLYRQSDIDHILNNGESRL